LRWVLECGRVDIFSEVHRAFHPVFHPFTFVVVLANFVIIFVDIILVCLVSAVENAICFLVIFNIRQFCSNHLLFLLFVVGGSSDSVSSKDEARTSLIQLSTANTYFILRFFDHIFNTPILICMIFRDMYNGRAPLLKFFRITRYMFT
jgi:hypothetical protein